MTKKDFILPLFDALGWKTADSREVTAEEKISKKRVDYGFRISGISKFFLEAKSLKEDWDNPKFFEQAVSYAWHKGCTWAVLTNFDRIKILNAEWRARNYLQSHFMTLEHWEFIKRFEDLSLLSRDSFEKDKLDQLAEKYGKKTKKESVRVSGGKMSSRERRLKFNPKPKPKRLRSQLSPLVHTLTHTLTLTHSARAWNNHVLFCFLFDSALHSGRTGD